MLFWTVRLLPGHDLVHKFTIAQTAVQDGGCTSLAVQILPSALLFVLKTEETTSRKDIEK